MVTGNRPPGPMFPSSTNSPALALAAEAERLELADDLEGERVVELADVDVGRSEPGHGEGRCAAARRPDRSRRESLAPAQVQAGGMR